MWIPEGGDSGSTWRAKMKPRWLTRMLSHSRFRKGYFHLPIIAVIIIIILIIVVVVIVTLQSPEEKQISEKDRIECPGLTEDTCAQMWCHYQKVENGPACYMEKNDFSFRVQNLNNETDGMSINLQNIAQRTPYGDSMQDVTFRLTYITENILRFQFKETYKERYEVPVQTDFPLLKNPPGANVSNLNYEVIHSEKSEVFNFGVKRLDEDTYLWDTRIGALLLSDQYLQIGSYLPSEYVYGLGEHVHKSLKHNLEFVTWPMFAADSPATASSSQKNLYGVHPFYTCLESSGKSHGVLFLNSNAMEVTFMPEPAVSFRTVGGNLDFFMFIGDNPEHVIQLYTSLIGRPVMPPYWSLGFQLSRYGYQHLVDLEFVLNKMKENDIPQTVQYLDIDHLDDSKDFTWDNSRFQDLPTFINNTKGSGGNGTEDGLKWIIILDPAIAAVDDYEAYKSGLEKSVFIKRSPNWNGTMFPEDLASHDVTFGRVWPSVPVAFPDFFLNETKEWWIDNIVKHRETIQFDGLWIDMNEPANFGTNEKEPEYCNVQEEDKPCWSLMCPVTINEDPPYNPLYRAAQRLSHKTICMDSIHSPNIPHFNVHSLYGWSQTEPTLKGAQTATGKRSIVISRSTYPSSGRYAGHWLGDNESTFEDMKRSIIGMLEFNMFGIPYIGADVCGFFGDTTDELCKRWMQLGAFYPFFRNHNNLGQKEQSPASLGPEVARISKNVINRRLRLNPYLYTLFYRAHVDGNTVVRPLFHEFANEKVTWDMDTAFMWGSSILVTPVLEQGRKTINKYLPKTDWWLFKEHETMRERFTGHYVVGTDTEEYAPMHIRGGTILPYGKVGENLNLPVTNISLYVFPLEHKAEGELFIDDGESIDTIEKEEFALYKFSYENCTLSIETQEKSNFKATGAYLLDVVVFKASDIANATNADASLTVTSNKELQTAVITVNDEMKKIKEIKWQASDGSCKMQS